MESELGMRLRPDVDFGVEFKRLYAGAWDNVTVVSKRDPKRLLNLRCSQLPFCPLEFFFNTSRSPRFQQSSMASMYYTSVGTTVHTVMQTALMQHSDKIIGNWTCLECGLVKKFTTQPRCCGFPMQYEELDIDYKGIQGHVDTLFLTNKPKKIKNGKFWVVDYKTCSMNNKDAKMKNPGDAYKEQILSYVVLLTKQYNIHIEGAMLVFIPRDNPKEPSVWSHKVTDADFKGQVKKLKKYRMAHKAILNASKFKDLLRIYDEFGMCQKQDCPVCRSGNPAQALKFAFKQAQKLPLIEAFQ